jgi:hypothetical protein
MSVRTTTDDVCWLKLQLASFIGPQRRVRLSVRNSYRYCSISLQGLYLAFRQTCRLSLDALDELLAFPSPSRCFLTPPTMVRTRIDDTRECLC